MLTIELKRGRDGPSALTCIRADGSRTWSRVHPFFPTHDLMHAVVESVLGFDQAFWGLVASGWDLDDFAAPGAAARLPDQALWAEHLVGLLERRIATDAEAVNAALEASLAGGTPPSPPPPQPLLDCEKMARIEQRCAELFTEWMHIAPGDTMGVSFPVRFAETTGR